MKLEYETYREAREKFNYNERWEVFDGNRQKFNIAHECVDRHPRHREAIRIQFDNGKREIYTFGELQSLSSKFANLLIRRGVKHGDAVALILNPSLEFYSVFFGTLKRGAIVVPCSALFGPEAIGLRVKNSQAKVIISTQEKVHLIDKGISEDIIIAEELLDLLKKESDSFLPFTSAKDMAVMQFSSGTTGKPKAVSYGHEAGTLTAVYMKFAAGLRAGDRYFCPSSPAWGHGIWYGTVGPLIFGSAIGAYSGKFYAPILIEALERFKITNVFCTPLIYRSMMTSGKMESSKLQLRELSFTGGPTDVETLTYFREKLGIIPRSSYGSTEVGGVLLDYPFKDYKVKLGSLGIPMLGVKVAVVDDKGNEVPRGEVGQIAVWRNNNWVRIGDSGYMDNEGYYWYRGRIDDVIISAGYTIGAFEVEEVILKHQAVSKVAVVGSPDKERGEIVKAFVVLNPDFQPSEQIVKEIENLVKERLSKHEYPREIEFMSQLPQTLDGKIRRKELRELEKKRKSVY